MRRPVPAPVDRLPDQFFTTILARVAHARTLPGPPVVDLGRGNPDTPPPAHVLEALHAAVDEQPGVHGYPPFRGTRALRQAICARYLADHDVVLDPETEVALVPGTKSAITLAVLATTEAGETVALPDPGYPDYFSAVALAGARVAALGLDETTGFQPDWETLGADRPALTVLNYPSNPTAACAAPQTFEDGVARAHAHGTWLLHDLAYGPLCFDGRPGASILQTPGAREVAAELWSPSKAYGMAGWRIGFVVGNTELVARVRRLVDHTTAGVFSALQAGLTAALTGPQDDVMARRDRYAARRDRLVGALTAAGAHVAPCEGSFYVWWRMPEGLDAVRLLAEHRVGVAPGDGFGARGAGWARLSLATADDELDDGIARLAVALAAG